ncbi:hypothetical protein DH2020_045144 [Rehmannia glutinosa]|uniref:CCHC-type domain-containing protein n=1 Tax=Rehmannia glutinosa TaxID=99300 RepID=A0ABR0UF00_REHGL
MDQDNSYKLKSFSLSREEKGEIVLEEEDIAICKAECERSLIGRIFGTKKVNFMGIKNTTASIWQTKESFSVREIGVNLYQFVFFSEEDKIRVLKGKTWSFDNQYLILREWAENIMESIDTLNKVELWIQVWNLPHHWTGTKTGIKIGKKFEGCIDVIVPETGSSKGRFIKILALVNLDKPLLRGTNIKLGSELVWVDFRYENLQKFCFYCGFVGHTERVCNNRREDLQKDQLIAGQFGDWLRAIGIYPNKSSPKKWRTQSANNIANQQAKLDEKREVLTPKMSLNAGRTVPEYPYEDKENKFMAEDSLVLLNQHNSVSEKPITDLEKSRKKTEFLILEEQGDSVKNSQNAEGNKENIMQFESVDMIDVLVELKGNKAHLREIQNTKKGRGGKGCKKNYKNRRRGQVKDGTQCVATPMETYFDQEDNTTGHKRHLELEQDPDLIAKLAPDWGEKSDVLWVASLRHEHMYFSSRDLKHNTR